MISPSFLPPPLHFPAPTHSIVLLFFAVGLFLFLFYFFYFYVRALVVCVLLALVSASCCASPSSRFLLVFLLKRSIHSFYVCVCIRTHTCTHTCIVVIRICCCTYICIGMCVRSQDLHLAPFRCTTPRKMFSHFTVGTREKGSTLFIVSVCVCVFTQLLSAYSTHRFNLFGIVYISSSLAKWLSVKLETF